MSGSGRAINICLNNMDFFLRKEVGAFLYR
jgi:hypothetical protein